MAEDFDWNKPGRVGKTKRVDIAPQRDDPDRFDVELSAAEIEAIRAEARESVAKEIRKQKEKALLDKFITEERQAAIPAKRLVPVFLQLAGSTNYIMLDGHQYYHDNVYHVEQAVAAVLLEQMTRSWAHEEITQVSQTKGNRRHRPPIGLGFGNFTGERAPRNAVFNSAQMATAPAEQLLGVKMS